MRRTFTLIVLIYFILLTSGIANLAFGASQAAGYLCEFGIVFYRQGKYDDALTEFKKVLLLEPENNTAKEYINTIFQKGILPVTKPEKPIPSPAKIKEEPVKRPTREEVINNTLAKVSKGKEKPEVEIAEKSPVVLRGEQRLSMGITPDDVIWKDANADRVGVPHEKNWRYLWGDQRHNTFDPKIYDRLKLEMQTQLDNPFNAFMEIDIDPWTFIGKNRVSISYPVAKDVVDMDIKYWSGDQRTINETYRSERGRIVRLKQIKVDDGKTTLSELLGISVAAPAGAAFGTIQPMEIDRDYRPIRKIWFDYRQDDYLLKFFPLSDQYEALTSDDPLRLSNNHAYWEESPWLDEYEPSRIFKSDIGRRESVKPGKWIRRLSYFSKDSSDDYPHRLTFLRGASFKSDTGAYALEATLATPMSLWDEYERSNSVDGAARLRIPYKDDLQFGFTTAAKFGLDGGSLEAGNYVGATDFVYQLLSYGSVYGEFAGSHTEIREAKGFNTSYDGIGAKLGFIYDAAKEKDSGIYNGEFYLGHMDGKFYPGLSNYRYTRGDDPTFSRHIYFAKIKKEDEALIWGDGIDRGRNTAGFKLNARAFGEKLNADIKARYVREDNGKYIESVLRNETNYDVNSRLTSKILAYYQHLPRTHANYDPVIFQKTMYSLTDYFSEEDLHPENSDIIDDKDPSIGAFGLGAKYNLIEDVVSVEGIYERTNDPLDFPRSLLNEITVGTETRDDVVWDKVTPYLYDQSFFDLPPYHYYNIAKSKLIYTPTKQWEFILGYTFNENKYTSGMNDNINHLGLEAKYTPTAKLTFWSKYVYSRLVDIYKQNEYQSSDFYEGHHNFFFGSEYYLNKDESFTFLYGEFVGYNDPYQQSNWSLSALDTQHIFRLFYRRKF